jgi:hypothetical protein
VYAYVGVLLLGSVRWNRGLTEHANFSRFWTALLTLLRVATGDNWVDVMAGCRVQVGSSFYGASLFVLCSVSVCVRVLSTRSPPLRRERGARARAPSAVFLSQRGAHSPRTRACMRARVKPPTHNQKQKPPECDRTAGDCGSWVAVPYFLTFYLLVSVVMLNLFTAVILENFERMDEQVWCFFLFRERERGRVGLTTRFAHAASVFFLVAGRFIFLSSPKTPPPPKKQHNTKDQWVLRPENLSEFVDLWAEYDDGSGSIEPRELEALLMR